MRKGRKIFCLCVAVGMLYSMVVTAAAADITASSVSLDFRRKGSVAVEIFSGDTGTAVPGGTLTLYEVAVARQAEGNAFFELTDAFSESGASLSGISETDAETREMAARLETYASSNQIEGQSVTVDENGRAEWTELELGLYLVVNTTAAEGYAPINTFLVSVPRYLDGNYVYDVKANPKAGTAAPVPADTPKPSKKTTVTDKTLPQTGQLWWPVPVLVFAGSICVTAGWYRRRCFDKTKHSI